ncbi:PmoA family protein [Actinotalea sp. BY-33]|uniref:PmoA family protein n=1 Tax=Actinotalea soli TaxID=2819234 RepID=A0A939LQC8_9CELL|nr:PmoA family protein [Actinotalea soli]
MRAPGGPDGAGPAVALVGVHGHGRSHLGNIWRLHRAGALRLVGLVDLTPLDEAGPWPPEVTSAEDRAALLATPWTEDVDAMLAEARPDVVVICTPIHTHADLAARALRAGADVLLEKPTTASLAEFDELLDVEQETGRVVQVGFQTFGSTALSIVHELVADGLIGEVTGVGATGTWVRSLDYWTRSRWTGRRQLEGRPVVDGVTTNPLAHAVATALHLADARTTEDVVEVELDQYRANDVEVDDTTAVRITTATGLRVTLGLTLCAPEHTQPRVIVQGTTGRAILDYYADTVTVTRPDEASGSPAGRSHTLQGSRTTLLEDLLAHRSEGTPLLSPLAGTGAFMRVLDAVRAAPDPLPIGPEHVTSVTDELGTHLVVDGVATWCARVATEHRTFAELGAPWAATPGSSRSTPAAPRPVKIPPWSEAPTWREHGDLLRVEIAGTEVARYVDGSGSPDFDSPRPHLHPVRTPGGTVVTDAAPLDHTWHLGLAVGVQDVAGANLWGGRTYLRGAGYTWRRDHGRIVHQEWVRRAPGSVSHRLLWAGPDGQTLLEEVRDLAWSPLDAGSWRLDLAFHLNLPEGVEEPVELGSPGSHGRDQGGYGGLFWRVAPCEGIDLRTPAARGEAAVHGTRPADGARWLAWSATASAAGGDGAADRGAEGAQDFTIAVLPADEQTAQDPWFVRAADYPGLGSALAWDAPVEVGAAGLSRSFTILVADGRWEDGRVEAALQDMTHRRKDAR